MPNATEACGAVKVIAFAIGMYAVHKIFKYFFCDDGQEQNKEQFVIQVPEKETCWEPPKGRPRPPNYLHSFKSHVHLERVMDEMYRNFFASQCIYPVQIWRELRWSMQKLRS